MSTYIYLTCKGHDPELRAEDESGQHAHTDITKIREWVALRPSLLTMWDDGELYESSYFLRNTLRFLAQHRECDLGAVDEYDRDWSLVYSDPCEPTTKEPTA